MAARDGSIGTADHKQDSDNHCHCNNPVSSKMGAVSTELARWAWAAQKPLMGPLWRRSPLDSQLGPPFAHTVPVCSLGCHAICVLCRQILQGQAAVAPIVSRIVQSMAKRRAARARARRARAAAAAGGAATTGRKVRRGSWQAATEHRRAACSSVRRVRLRTRLADASGRVPPPGLFLRRVLVCRDD